jgi:hypothetical protein
VSCRGLTAEVRFWSKVERHDVDCPCCNGCWWWKGGKHEKGYGRFWFADRVQPAHRIAYELLIGLIPDGLQLDHLCRTPSCVNPAHLEPVTRLENLRRGIHVNRSKTHCPAGHAYDAENTYIEGGRRHCRICLRAHGRAHYWRYKRAA